MRTATVLGLLLLPMLAMADPLEESLADLNHSLSALEGHGPNYPPTLDLLRLRALAYARAQESDCEQHMALATEDAKRFIDNPYSALLPSFAVKKLSLEATLAWGRGQCSESEDVLVHETESARDTALEGVEVAAQIRDYDSEAFLRFQVANYQRILGDMDECFAMLESAIRLDDAHGLADDGAENRTILAKWKDVDVATLPKAPTPAKVSFRFDWHPVRMDVDLTIRSSVYADGKAKSRTFDATGSERLEVRPDGGFRWTIETIDVASRSALAESDEEARAAQFLQSTTAKVPPVDVAKDGSFIGIADFERYQTEVRKSSLEWLDSEAPANDPKRAAIEAALTATMKSMLTREAFENSAAREHALTTSIWIGSTLETGQAMTLDLNLPLDGAPPAVIMHRLEFRLDGIVPCNAADMTKPHCVELEMQASPKDEAIKAIADKLQQQGKGKLHYWSDLTMHLVVDPNTMLTYEQQLQRAHYLQLADSQIAAGAYQQRGRHNYHP